MDADDILSQFTVRTPCPMDWDRMPGDERKRFCAKCGKDVFNLTAMKPYETVSLVCAIREPGEQRCVRVYQRPDGTLAATGCPTAPPGAEKPWQFTIRSLMAVIAGCAAFLGLAKWLSPELPQPTPPPAANSQVMGDIY